MKPTLLQFLGEARVLTQVRLTNNQKKVLSIIVMNGEGRVHDEEISSDRNMVGARELLMRLGLIEQQEDDWIAITEKGKQIAEQEGLTKNGELTDQGNQAATANQAPPPSGRPSTAPTPGEDGAAPQPFAQTSGDVGQEGLS
jgi:hypothetical protein